MPLVSSRGDGSNTDTAPSKSSVLVPLANSDASLTQPWSLPESPFEFFVYLTSRVWSPSVTV